MENQKKGCISMVEANLPPGFRFHPRDDELVCDYLVKRLGRDRNRDCGRHHSVLLVDVDLNKCEPWDLPQTACVGGKEWYFYSQRDRKYATGLRTNRATVTGYWKATGKDRAVVRKGSLVGMRKTLVFYKGRAPKGRKTDWVMHEFRLEGPFAPPNITSLFLKEDWVLCRVFQKSKEVGSKDSMRSCSDETGSSSLPPLMDSYITFNHSDYQDPSTYLNEDNCITEQVPCFSISSQNHDQNQNQNPSQTNPILPNLTGLASDPKVPSKNPNPLLTGSVPAMALDSFCSDQMVLRALLSQLTKIDGNLNAKESPSFGEGSSESFLTEIGIPSTVWNY